MSEHDNIVDLNKILSITDISIIAKNINVPINEIKSISKVNYGITIIDSVFPEHTVYLIEKTISIVITANTAVVSEIGNISVKFSFNLPTLTTFIQETEKGYLINRNLSNWLDHMVIASMRGIMYSEFRGTFLEKVILPITEPEDRHSENR